MITVNKKATIQLDFKEIEAIIFGLKESLSLQKQNLESATTSYSQFISIMRIEIGLLMEFSKILGTVQDANEFIVNLTHSLLEK